MSKDIFDASTPAWREKAMEHLRLAEDLIEESHHHDGSFASVLAARASAHAAIAAARWSACS